MRDRRGWRAVVVAACVALPGVAWAGEQPAVERLSAQLTPAGFAAVGPTGRFSLPQFRVFDAQGRQVLEMDGFVPARFKPQLQEALARPQAMVGGRTLGEELARMTAGDGAAVVVPAGVDFTLVEYWAEWCVPCKLLERQLEEVLADARLRLAVLRVEADPEKILRGGGGPRVVQVVDVASLDPDLVSRLRGSSLSPEEREALMAKVVEAGALKRVDLGRLTPELRAKLESGNPSPEDLQRIFETAGVDGKN